MMTSEKRARTSPILTITIVLLCGTIIAQALPIGAGRQRNTDAKSAGAIMALRAIVRTGRTDLLRNPEFQRNLNDILGEEGIHFTFTPDGGVATVTP